MLTVDVAQAEVAISFESKFVLVFPLVNRKRKELVSFLITWKVITGSSWEIMIPATETLAFY